MPAPIVPLVTSTRTLKQGQTGPAISALQLALKALGYKLSGTGFFGPATDSAVSAFQKLVGLTQDGEVGPKTAKAIDDAVASLSKGVQLRPEIKQIIERPLWLEAGMKYLGTKEFAGGRDNPVIIEWAKDEGGDIAASYTHDSIPWCSLFENMILTKVGLKGTETLWALDWNADRMEKRLGRRWPGVRLLGPAVGAICPMLRNGGGHIMTLVGKDQNGNAMGLGGNQSDAVTIAAFPRSRLNEGFWWPKSVPLPTLQGWEHLPVVKSDGKVSTREA